MEESRRPPADSVTARAGSTEVVIVDMPRRTRGGSEGIFVLAEALLPRWKLLIWLPTLIAVGAGILSFLVPPRYTSTVSFAAEARGGGLQLPSALSGLAGQFGVNLGAPQSESPAYYVEVLHSRHLLERVLTARYTDREGSADSATLLQLVDARGHTPAEVLADGVRRLNERIAASADNQTGIIRLNVSTRRSALSAAVANRFVTFLDDFNLQRAKIQARARREFIEERTKQAADALGAAEDSLQHFLQANRIYEHSPDLLFEYQRLQRQVQLRQEFYLSLSRAYATSRIEEANDVPVVTVIDSAVPPVRRSYPSRRLWVVMGFLIGLTIALSIAGLRHFIDRLRADSPERAAALGETWRGVRREIRSLGRGRSGRLTG